MITSRYNQRVTRLLTATVPSVGDDHAVYLKGTQEVHPPPVFKAGSRTIGDGAGSP